MLARPDDADTDAVVSKVKLTKFHAVFVINPSWTGEYHEQVQKMYSEIIKKFTDACVTEQNERGYISLEAYKIHKIMRDAEEKGTSNFHCGVDFRITDVVNMGGTNQYIQFGIRNRKPVQLNHS